MSRFKYLLSSTITTQKIVGIFPFNTLIEKQGLDIRKGVLNFSNSGIEGLKILAQQQYSVVLFINQFKTPISFEDFQKLTTVIENFVKGHNINVLGVYWCPSNDKNDPYVVPNAGMFSKVTEHHNINWTNIPVISTSSIDLTAASKVNAVGIKIGSGADTQHHFDTFYEWVKSL